MVTNILMFIGGGSAGTAGGIKITTFLVLGFSIWNEVRGRDEVTIAHRSISCLLPAPGPVRGAARRGRRRRWHAGSC